MGSWDPEPSPTKRGCSEVFGECPALDLPILICLRSTECKHLDLLEGDLKAEGLVEVGVQGLLLHRRLLLLEPLAILHQVDLHVGVCAGKVPTSEGLGSL